MTARARAVIACCVLWATAALASQGVDMSAARWRMQAREQLTFARSSWARAALEAASGSPHARNVVLFIGDGMGIPTVTAAGMHRAGEGTRLLFERFPFTGLSKTYSVSKQVGDSAATGTAFLTGVKTSNGVLGMDASVVAKQCPRPADVAARLTSLAGWAQAAGRVAGVVTTTRITHATPAALYARSAHRDWECDTELPEGCQQLDIARQLVEEMPGMELRVVLGGGRKQLGDLAAAERDGTDDDGSCGRADGRNLTAQWLRLPGRRHLVHTREQLLQADLDKVDYLMGLFSAGHIPYTDARRPREHPSLVEMTQQALRLLSRHDNGYFLLVEGGRIDHGHHKNYARRALEETLELEAAVAAALTLTDPKDTLIVVTADHSHTMSISGYPNRGTDILGFVHNDGEEPYETLTYANGPSFYTHRSNDTNSTWVNVMEMNRSAPTYQHFSPRYLKDETHGGEDVAVYAVGPGAYLFTGVYEQNYLAHAMAHIANIGPDAMVSSANTAHMYNFNVTALVSLLASILLGILR
ncbi:alkaline phosphatase 4-like [Schistocerca cancellata]|uniref:alkaline phosphatase 4-like n=1 Tax=Schistocerca cancellata TaxID=274614 RepID=UPI002118D482|nr:alkaline phosphatase 4-like [Schistocerca cancellata]